MNIDTYRELFQKFVADGMTYIEAEEQFDKDRLREAVNAELERGDCRQVMNWKTMIPENACGHETLFDLVVKATSQRSDQTAMQQCYDLWGAGWTHEVPEQDRNNSRDFWRQSKPMSWYWRAPSKRAGKPGRRYLSTNQAWSALQKSK